MLKYTLKNIFKDLLIVFVLSLEAVHGDFLMLEEESWLERGRLGTSPSSPSSTAARKGWPLFSAALRNP